MTIQIKNILPLVVLMILSSCKLIKPVFYNLPDEKDGMRFPSRTINPSENVFMFKRAVDTVPQIRNLRIEDKALNSTGVPIDEFVQLYRTVSFLIIRNDSILYEYYGKNYNEQKEVASFSISKTYIAMLTGIAIHDGLIKSIDEPVTDFIPEWKDKEGYRLITIKNLLKHTSGLKFTENPLNPFSDQAQFYYGSDLRKRILATTILEPPGQHFDYQSENSALLGLIIERATGKTLSTYLEEKIWKRIGTEAPAFWNTDGEGKDAIEKSFCCLNARTLDYARFARLLLRKGNWQGEQIVPEKWIDAATEKTTKEGSKSTYGYNIGLGPEKYKSFFPIGLYGQLLYIYPEKNLLIIRFGNATVNYKPDYWKEIMLQIVDQL